MAVKAGCGGMVEEWFTHGVKLRFSARRALAPSQEPKNTIDSLRIPLIVRAHEQGTHSRSRIAHGQGGVTAGRQHPMRKDEGSLGGLFCYLKHDKQEFAGGDEETEQGR